jgi:sorting nexin-1/2
MFVDFRSALQTRYPGLYVPPIPPKKTTGKKDEAIVKERMHFLDLFLKECCELRYIAASPELQMFLRPSGDLEVMLKKIYKPKPGDLLAIYRATLPVVEVSDRFKLYYLDFIGLFRPRHQALRR